MRFVRVPDDRPSPQTYLRAGIPRPTDSVDGYPPARSLSVVGQDNLPELAEIHPHEAPSGNSFTVTDLSGAPIAVVWARSSQYLTRPAARSWVRAEIVSATRAPTGVLDLRRGTRDPIRPRPVPAPVDPAADRVVTIDPSVVLAGLDPERFRSDDAIFVSAAIAMELAVTVGAPADAVEAEPSLVSFSSWDLTTPVPIDHYVLRMYAHLCDTLDPPLTRAKDLDRTDLICAATAILYEAPLYTTKPEAYRGVTGLKVLEYGPVRTKNA